MPAANGLFLVWTQEGWHDYLYWQDNDPKIVLRINELIKDTLRHPFEGIGKPEPLRHKLKGLWSRRITQEHRLLYRVEGDRERSLVVVFQCRFHT